jgi:hypothetical protein
MNNGALIDYCQLRRQITMDQVLELVGFQAAWRKGPQLRGPCPIPGCRSAALARDRGTSSRVFSVHRTRALYRCFACGSRGNPLDLWAAICELPLYQAAIHLSHVTGIELPRLSSACDRPTRPLSSDVAIREPSRNR